MASGNLLAASFERNGLIGCVGHVERYNSALRSLQLRVRQGELGTVFQVATRRQGPFPYRIRDVGVVMDLATHDIDLTRWVAGSPYLKVAAFSANPSGRPARGPGRRQRRAAERHGHQPSGELAVSHEGAARHRDRRTRLPDRGYARHQLWFQRNGAVTADGPPGQPFHARIRGRPDPLRVRRARRHSVSNWRTSATRCSANPPTSSACGRARKPSRSPSAILDAALTGTGSPDGAHDQQPATPGCHRRAPGAMRDRQGRRRRARQDRAAAGCPIAAKGFRVQGADASPCVVNLVSAGRRHSRASPAWRRRCALRLAPGGSPRPRYCDRGCRQRRRDHRRAAADRARWPT